MPEMPAFWADIIEPRYSKPARVIAVENVSPQFRRVQLEGEAFRGAPFVPGCEIEFRVSPREFRHYTPVRIDAEQGRFEVWFLLHGYGPGSRWGAELEIGDEVKLYGPGGKFAFDQVSRPQVFMGDSTCLAVFYEMVLSLADRSTTHAVVELSEEELPLIERLELPLTPVLRAPGETRGEPLLRYLQENKPTIEAAYLAGHTQSISALRRVLLKEWELPRKAIRTLPYWADGKKGL